MPKARRNCAGSDSGVCLKYLPKPCPTRYTGKVAVAEPFVFQMASVQMMPSEDRREGG